MSHRKTENDDKKKESCSLTCVEEDVTVFFLMDCCNSFWQCHAQADAQQFEPFQCPDRHIP